MRNVMRDPFARGTLTAERVHSPAGTCSWCGQLRTTRNGRPWLYRFGWDDDQNSPRYSGKDSRLFCSRSCRETYHS